MYRIIKKKFKIKYMNREIKFRAWDKKNKIMTYSPINCINFDGQLLLNDGQYYDIEKTDYVLMQFTGLLDKNGKEIYEGDIVCWTFNEKQKNQIVYHEGCFGHLNLTGINKEHSEFIPINKVRAEYMIVCGNIYQNPELLTEK